MFFVFFSFVFSFSFRSYHVPLDGERIRLVKVAEGFSSHRRLSQNGRSVSSRLPWSEPGLQCKAGAWRGAWFVSGAWWFFLFSLHVSGDLVVNVSSGVRSLTDCCNDKALEVVKHTQCE